MKTLPETPRPLRIVPRFRPQRTEVETHRPISSGRVPLIGAARRPPEK